MPHRVCWAKTDMVLPGSWRGWGMAGGDGWRWARGRVRRLRQKSRPRRKGRTVRGGCRGGAAASCPHGTRALRRCAPVPCVGSSMRPECPRASWSLAEVCLQSGGILWNTRGCRGEGRVGGDLAKGRSCPALPVHPGGVASGGAGCTPRVFGWEVLVSPASPGPWKDEVRLSPLSRVSGAAALPPRAVVADTVLPLRCCVGTRPCACWSRASGLGLGRASLYFCVDGRLGVA